MHGQLYCQDLLLLASFIIGLTATATTITITSAADPTKTTNSNACERAYGRQGNFACKCNATVCDTELDFQWPTNGLEMVELVSSQAGARFQLRRVPLGELLAINEEKSEQNENSVERIVHVDLNKRFQQIVGYGGAVTDSASLLIWSKLDIETRRRLMTSYFGPRGLNYNMARVPIGGTDMSVRPYSYDDFNTNETPDDFELKHFKLQREDFELRLPLISEANRIRRQSSGKTCDTSEDLRIVATSWSAPNWMKSNGNLVQGRLKESPDGRYYDAYARYLIRFMDEYESELSKLSADDSRQLGLNCTSEQVDFKIWALTPQNEPCTPGRLGYSVVNYNSVNFEPKQMAQFVRYNLIPNLLRANRTRRQLALFIWDDTLLGYDRYKNQLFSHLLEDENDVHLLNKQLKSGYLDFERQIINDYVRGLALHWYSQALDKLPYKSLYDLRRSLPLRYSMLSTEASFIGHPKLGEWVHGEKYARDIIENLRAGSIGWIDWNLALNMHGGPAWSGNYLDAPILIDERAGVFYKNPMFYAIGHLSRFIKTSSHIVGSEIYINDHQNHQLEANFSSNKFKESTQSNEAKLTVDEMSQLATLTKDQGWRMVDELEEQTSALLVVASELDGPSQWRRIGLVLLNRSHANMPIKLVLANCKSQLGLAGPLSIVLEAKSITSYAFNC